MGYARTLNKTMVIVWFLVAFLVGIILGAAGGSLASLKIAGKDLGNGFAALIGSFFGLTHAIPVMLIGLIILYFIS